MPSKALVIRNSSTCLVLLVALLAFGFYWSTDQRITMSKRELQLSSAILLHEPIFISDFQLIDHLKQPFDSDRLRDQWSILFFAFSSCPDICPTTLSTLGSMYTMMSPQERQKVKIYMVSLDGERDTPEKLATYVPYFNADFIGVTGEEASVRQLTSQLNVAFERAVIDGDNYTIDHSTQLVLVNPNGQYHGFFKPPHSETILRQNLRSIVTMFGE